MLIRIFIAVLILAVLAAGVFLFCAIGGNSKRRPLKRLRLHPKIQNAPSGLLS